MSQGNVLTKYFLPCAKNVNQYFPIYITKLDNLAEVFSYGWKVDLIR